MLKKMKKLFTLALGLSLSASNVCSAQNLYAGLAGGANYSTLRGYENFEPGYKALPTYGLNLFYTGTGKWSSSVSVLLSERGVTYTQTSTDSLQTATRKYDESLRYLEIPVLFHYSFGSDSSRFIPRVFFGPSLNVRASGNRNIDYTLRAKNTLTDTDTIVSASVTDQDLSFIYTPIDYGVVAGAGITYKITDRLSASLDARFTYGLMDIREILSNSSPKISNMFATVSFGVMYNLSSVGKKKENKE
jgi:hypothetical protein